MDCTVDSEKIKRKVGYLPAEVNYYDDMKVRELLVYSSEFYGGNHNDRIEELCEMFEVEKEKSIDDLSTGNKKKVAIVQALLHEPRLLILDEPTSGLDPLMQQKFFDVLKSENEKGVTIFFSSHILSEVQKMCSRVAIIREGRILKVETIENLRAASYKKVRVDFGSVREAERYKLDGMTNQKNKDNQVSFLYSGDIGKLIGSLSGEDISNLFIEEPELEEIFMHYYVNKE